MNGAAHGDDLSNSVRHSHGEPTGEQAAHAEPDNADWPIPVGKLREAIGGTVEETLGWTDVDAQVPSVSGVAELGQEVAHLRCVGVSTSQSGQHQDGVAVAPR